MTAKTCMLTSAHHPILDPRIFHKQAVTLHDSGYRVTIIGPHSNDTIVDGINIRGIPKARNRFVRMFLSSWRIFRRSLKEKADIYHFHDPDLIPVGLFLKFLGAKVIYDVHEDYPASIRASEWMPHSMRWISASAFDVLEKICHCFFDATVAATGDISKRFRSSRSMVLHNYPVLNCSLEMTNHKSCSKDHTIIYVGALSKVRGISEIMQSLEYIDEKLRVKLKLLGKFTESDFEKEIRATEIFSQVDLKYVPYKEVILHLSNADIGLVLLHPLPNYIRSMPTKLFEYMSAGLPVIASNFPLWKHIVEKNNCGLTVDPTKPREIAAAVEYLMERPELMEEMGKNGKMAALKEYNWEQESVKLLDLMTRLTGR